MTTQRIERLKRMGFEVVDAMPADGSMPGGDGAPFRSGEVQVTGGYPLLTRRERCNVWLSTPFGSITRPAAAVLTTTHFYGRFLGRGGDLFARIPRTRFQLCWRDGAATLFQLETGYCVALPAPRREALLVELETEVKSLPDAPFRSDGRTRDLLVGSIVAVGSLVLAALVALKMAGLMGAVALLAAAAYFALFVFAMGGGHTLVTAEGVTMTVGVLPTSTRIFRRAHFHSVVLRVHERPVRSTVTIELEVRKPTGGGTWYVIARATTHEPAREFVERVMAPDARRVAALLGALGPRWEK